MMALPREKEKAERFLSSLENLLTQNVITAVLQDEIGEGIYSGKYRLILIPKPLNKKFLLTKELTAARGLYGHGRLAECLSAHTNKPRPPQVSKIRDTGSKGYPSLPVHLFALSIFCQHPEYSPKYWQRH